MTRNETRNASRRGADHQGIGYGVAWDAPTRIVKGKRWPAPEDIRSLNKMIRQRERTGLCVVCGQPAGTMAGATCKQAACIRAFVLGQV